MPHQIHPPHALPAPLPLRQNHPLLLRLDPHVPRPRAAAPLDEVELREHAQDAEEQEAREVQPGLPRGDGHAGVAGFGEHREVTGEAPNAVDRREAPGERGGGDHHMELVHQRDDPDPGAHQRGKHVKPDLAVLVPRDVLHDQRMQREAHHDAQHGAHQKHAHLHEPHRNEPRQHPRQNTQPNRQALHVPRLLRQRERHHRDRPRGQRECAHKQERLEQKESEERRGHAQRDRGGIQHGGVGGQRGGGGL
eukprot:CAMPEP_0174907574 /NCGR_PEP_ID=MMETSP0167-20121228/61328_1 /TAXON_ID=38298 /ORGANISM="Rhodella maculata, Strain CCMP736" /LENGTH=249 /DNA_ID=CAMNT_0016151085 /DNA_START=45 /DNA_END=791 /DNA_ORIENTATION=+